MSEPRSSFDAAEVTRLAELAGLSLSDDDAVALAIALTAHTEMVKPLFEAALEQVPVASTYDPRWRDADGGG